MTQQVLAKKEKVGKIDTGEKLKTALDLLDVEVIKSVSNSFEQSRLKIELGMWDKGEKISSYFRGVKSEPSWNELSKITGRSDKSLKRWFDIFRECPDRQTYCSVAEKKAQEWTKKFLLTSAACLTQAVSNGLPEPKGEDRGLEFFKCLAEHYDGREPDEIWLAHCAPCLKIGLCRQIVSITQEFFKRWDKEHKGRMSKFLEFNFIPPCIKCKDRFRMSDECYKGKSCFECPKYKRDHKDKGYDSKNTN